MKQNNDNYINKLERQTYEILRADYEKYNTKYGCLTQKKYLDYFTDPSSKFSECNHCIPRNRYTMIMLEFTNDMLNLCNFGFLSEVVNDEYNVLNHPLDLWNELRLRYAKGKYLSMLDKEMYDAIPLFSADETFAALYVSESRWRVCGGIFIDLCENGVIGKLLKHLKFIEEEAYNKVYKGIFWIKDIDEFERQCVIKKIPVDILGNIREEESIRLELNSKNGDNYNHEASWGTLPHSMTDGKNFDYYPRGRVEVKNKKAIIYANPTICGEQLELWAKKEFQLNRFNGIEKVTIKPDFSKHYECYLDR